MEAENTAAPPPAAAERAHVRPRAGFGARAVWPRHAANDNAPSLLWLSGQAARWMGLAAFLGAGLYAVFG